MSQTPPFHFAVKHLAQGNSTITTATTAYIHIDALQRVLMGNHIDR